MEPKGLSLRGRGRPTRFVDWTWIRDLSVERVHSERGSQSFVPVLLYGHRRLSLAPPTSDAAQAQLVVDQIRSYGTQYAPHLHPGWSPENGGLPERRLTRRMRRRARPISRFRIFVASVLGVASFALLVTAIVIDSHVIDWRSSEGGWPRIGVVALSGAPAFLVAALAIALDNHRLERARRGEGSRALRVQCWIGGSAALATALIVCLGWVMLVAVGFNADIP